MLEINPTFAAQLAERVYLVQSENQVPLFLVHPVFRFKDQKASYNHLKAEVGGRVILNHKDGFGMCVEGGDDNKGEVFLVFRGTTMANKGADVLTDARIGITMSSTGLPVHCGFHHCFSSMLPKIQTFFNMRKGHAKVVHCIGQSLDRTVAYLATDWVTKILNTSMNNPVNALTIRDDVVTLAGVKARKSLAAFELQGNLLNK